MYVECEQRDKFRMSSGCNKKSNQTTVEISNSEIRFFIILKLKF